MTMDNGQEINTYVRHLRTIITNKIQWQRRAHTESFELPRGGGVGRWRVSSPCCTNTGTEPKET